MVGVTDARGESPPVDTPALLCPADELADDDGLVSGCAVGLAVAELVGVVVGLADVPALGDFNGAFDAFAVAHGLLAAGPVWAGVLLPGLETAVALDFALPVALGLPVAAGLPFPLGLAVELALALELALAGAVGLAGELGAGVDGVARVVLADGADGELDDEVGEAADDGRQDVIGVAWPCAADVFSDPALPARA
jgi:hypothetical protein